MRVIVFIYFTNQHTHQQQEQEHTQQEPSSAIFFTIKIGIDFTAIRLFCRFQVFFIAHRFPVKSLLPSIPDFIPDFIVFFSGNNQN